MGLVVQVVTLSQHSTDKLICRDKLSQDDPEKGESASLFRPFLSLYSMISFVGYHDIFPLFVSSIRITPYTFYSKLFTEVTHDTVAHIVVWKFVFHKRLRHYQKNIIVSLNNRRLSVRSCAARLCLLRNK
jgi:hypothetical protein